MIIHCITLKPPHPMSDPTKEELERIKLQQEIKALKRPFFLRAEFLSIFVSSILGAIALLVSLNQANSDELEAIKTEKLELANEVNNQKAENLKKEALTLQKSIAELSALEKQLKDSLDLRFQRELLLLEARLKQIRAYTENYRMGYANGRLKNRRVNDNIQKFVRPEQEKAFRQWLYSELNRAIDVSINRAIDEIELERKLAEYQNR